MIKTIIFILLLTGCESAEDVLNESYQRKFTTAHNLKRNYRGLAPLVWNVKLEKHARSWANHLAIQCRANRSSGSGYSENIYQVWGKRGEGIKQIVDSWDVKKESVIMGCASSACLDPLTLSSSVIYVCNYFP